jgi:hypothetical protein
MSPGQRGSRQDPAGEAYLRYSRLLAAVISIGIAGSAGAQDATPAAANIAPAAQPAIVAETNREYYWEHTFGPPAHFGAFTNAGWNQLRTSPDEWGGGSDGFGKRLASAYARRFIKNTVDFGVAGFRGEVMPYSRCLGCGGWARVGHAVKDTFLRKTDDGGTTLALGRMAGAFGAGFAPNLWYPDSRNSFGDGLRRSGYCIGLDAGKNVLKEFWPDIKRKLFRR